MFGLKTGGTLLLLFLSLIAYSSYVSAHNRNGTSAICENYNPRLDRCGAETLITSHNTPPKLKPKKIYEKASVYEGLNENKNRKSLRKLVGVDPVEVPWCAAFMNAILEREGFEGTNDNRARSFANYGEKVISPEVGDIVVLRSHVGIFVEYKQINDTLYVGVLGGNQSNSVKVSYFPVKKIIAIRRPIA
jgi:uncharacterized protein (TIGR02594 family)